IRMFIERFLPQGVAALGSCSGVGKTWFALSQAKALVTGEPFLGLWKVPERQKVLYLVPEVGDIPMRIRCEKMGIPMDGSSFRIRTMKDGLIRLDDPLLEMAIKDWKPVVFLDTAVRFAEGADENSSAQNANGLAEGIFGLIKWGAVVVEALHHSPKTTAQPDRKGKLPDLTLEN